MRAFVLAFGALMFILGCKKEDKPATSQAKVSLKVYLKYGNEDLSLNQYFATSGQDTFRTTMLKFYLSNLVLVDKEGKEYKEPESYHLISLDSPNQTEFTMQGVPSGEYTKIRFYLGIDSVRNHSGEQVGDLDPSNGMFWTWNDGYLFLRFEGSMKRTPAKGVVVHIGEDRYLTPYELSLPQPVQVNSSSTLTLPLRFDLHALFHSPNSIDLDSLSHGHYGKLTENLPYLISYGI